MGSFVKTLLAALLAAQLPVPGQAAYEQGFPSSYSYTGSFSYFYDIFDPTAVPLPAPTAMPLPAPTAVPIPAPSAVPIPAPVAPPSPAGPAATKTVTLSIGMTASGFTCSEYGEPEELVFETALEDIFAADYPDADAEGTDCADTRRRQLLSGTVSLAFDLTMTVASTATVSSLESTVSTTLIAALSNGDWDTAFTSAAASYTGTLDMTTVGVTGVSVGTEAPTPSPVAPTAAPVAPLLSSSWRLAPSMGFFAACLAVFATLWV